jgi:hypothetical protein
MKYELTIKVSKSSVQDGNIFYSYNLIDFLKKEKIDIVSVESDSKELDKIYVTMRFKENRFIVDPEACSREFIEILQKKFEDLTISYSLLYVDYSDD